jgi:hypothetical protein
MPNLIAHYPEPVFYVTPVMNKVTDPSNVPDVMLLIFSIKKTDRNLTRITRKIVL